MVRTTDGMWDDGMAALRPPDARSRTTIGRCSLRPPPGGTVSSSEAFVPTRHELVDPANVRRAETRGRDLSLEDDPLEDDPLEDAVPCREHVVA
jgi:hypothetical protein